MGAIRDRSGSVRSLAQRSSAAAKEIKELLGASARTMNEGAQRVSSVSIAFSQIDQAITQVSDVIEEISAASEEQTKGIEQVHQAVSQIDEVTQQNAALVEEAAAAAQSMQEQAGKMTQVVMFFKLGDESAESSRLSVVQSSAPTRLASGAGTPGKSRELSRPSTARIAANSNRAPASADTGDWQSF
ncbi:MAG TPA: methyl-accepting chemotaxis protein [Terriglobales bacterium]|nr:methyl-accepting chemotaxis protein [Terriglobales bacterium]